MNKELQKIKKILKENPDKRILILSTYGLNFHNLKYELQTGELYEKVLDDLFIAKYGYINKKDDVIKSLENLIEIKKVIKLFLVI